MAPTSSHCFPYRPHDYVYDPIFTVSGPTDHYKAAIAAKMSAAKFQICPIFPNMFSDLPTRPRIQLVKRRQRPIAKYEECLSIGKSKDRHLCRPPDVRGIDRSKFFVTVMNFPPKDIIPYQTSPTFTIERISRKRKQWENQKTRDVEVETKFRESTTQTDPWEPPYKIIGKGDPEILKLDFLKWGSGLPAGMREIQLIERARMKAAWEKEIKPDIRNENSLIQFRNYMTALELDEWAFREQEINEVQELRLQLLENMLNELHEVSKNRTEMRMKNYIAKKEAEKEEQIQKIRKQTARELRKLETKQRGTRSKYHSVNIVDEHVDKKSEIYAPLIRHGEHPKRWHFIIDEKLKKYKAQFIGVEHISTLPKWLNQATKIDKRTLHSNWPKRRLCIRETKWTAPVLKQLHEELKDLRKGDDKRFSTLRTRVDAFVEAPHTPEVEGISVEEEAQYQALVTLQSIIKGRAAQIMIYEGRDTCKELIQELKHSKGLLRKQKELKKREKFRVKAQQRDELIQMRMVEKLQCSLGKLQGVVVGSLLDFLNKELRRLLEERKAHAMCLLNERERYVREAIEAGRRQKELRRRREHDEMFKQIVKITQESVDLYLKDIITEGMDFVSQESSTEYVQKLAKQIEKETEDAYEELLSVDEEDEIIANLVLHFVLPEVNKKIIREKIAQQQKQNLKTIHNAIYSKLESLPKPAITEMQPDEIAASIMEDILTKLDEKIEETSISNLSDYQTSDIGGDDISEVYRKATIVSEAISEKDYKDPVDLYMSHLIEQEDEFVEFSVFSEEQGDFNLRKDVLETIPEADNETSSIKD
ncbi:cilia- and flagella-associated protein 91-like isoform X1 [Diorhabda carinulata]|uniref:cilia- and flagella-associated protein 91-like isoform X1 n=1 Tax=Diorhabda carinulata TaxID=1163345 RepID=UPI0025A301C1|nr:cilia- and flagella-associated protein 91-like isoform X1 [Diorhabda carinulata]